MICIFTAFVKVSDIRLASICESERFRLLYLRYTFVLCGMADITDLALLSVVNVCAILVINYFVLWWKFVS